MEYANSPTSDNDDPEKMSYPESSENHAHHVDPMLSLKEVTLCLGRPDISDILKEEADATVGRRMGVGGRLFVTLKLPIH